MHARVNGNVPVQVTSHVAPNTFWTELEKVHASSMAAIASANNYVLTLLEDTLSDPQRMANVKDSDELASAVHALDRDMQDHYARMEAIHNRHKDRTGAATDMRDLQETMAVMDEYQTAASIYSTIVARDHQVIIELLGLEEEAAKVAQQVQSDLTNPNVVSDVVARDVTPTQPENEQGS